jgi:hypothetical protein
MDGVFLPMNAEMNELRIQLLAKNKKVLNCATLQEAFGTRSHVCHEPVQCFYDGDTFHFLCWTHRGLKRMEFKIINTIEEALVEVVCQKL